ncbi:hypothetical protein M431DRAFT_717 [Trichoderma harzianum CBS 226.95]|uniref:Uncharacterized protein n=1 Tax=Trichoderma harzianum CBS 226.95 TaxID=983964 RepID=A0A2T4AUJ0_TRIHA|nr:hypothetical protein M431DRAFT_717 [Trichoderma harzianum CBS 226.95]PTB60709.1 hypothetical protein M431DRAFT_717 [Trichoderma harzianum CBS 226.95]
MAANGVWQWPQMASNPLWTDLVVDPGHPPSREDLRAPCSLDCLRPLLSGSDSKSFDVESRSSGAHERWSLPAEGRRFGGPRFLAPRVSTSLKRDAAVSVALVECRPDRIIESQVSLKDDAHDRYAPSSPPRLEYDQRFRRTTAEGERAQESRPSPSCENCPPEQPWYNNLTC